MEHKLPDLPYEKNALEPHISAETLDFHHDKHHATYVTNLNNLIKGTEFEDKSLEEIVASAPAGGIFNNAAQVWNHTFYWNCLKGGGDAAPSSDMEAKLAAAFGSFDAFKDEFTKAAMGRFGSGWDADRFPCFFGFGMGDSLHRQRAQIPDLPHST